MPAGEVAVVERRLMDVAHGKPLTDLAASVHVSKTLQNVAV